MSDTAYGVECFEVVDDGEPEKQLTVEGWFHARVGVRGMQLAIPDRPLMIEEWRNPSPGLISLFGETGRNCRFKLQVRIDAETEPKLPGTRLLVLLENNDGMTIDVSPQLTFTTVDPPVTFTEADQALVMRFEGLGDNCEFGLMQRQVGREQLSLLRYAGSPHTSTLIEAIDQDLEGFGLPEDLAIDDFHEEWIATSRRYRFAFHTGTHVGSISEEDIRAAESTKLTFMAQKLVEDFESGTKVFVRRMNNDEPAAGMEDVYDALRRKGPATLLWVVPASEEKPHGTVEHVRERLFLGTHARFAPYANALEYDPKAWLVLLRAAEAVMARHGPDGELVAAPAPEPAAAPTETDTASWRVLTGEAAGAPGQAAPASEIEPPPDDGGFIGRLFGRKRQDSV